MKTEAHESTESETKDKPVKEPWNKGKLMGQKPPDLIRLIMERTHFVELKRHLFTGGQKT